MKSSQFHIFSGIKTTQKSNLNALERFCTFMCYMSLALSSPCQPVFISGSQPIQRCRKKLPMIIHQNLI